MRSEIELQQLYKLVDDQLRGGLVSQAHHQLVSYSPKTIARSWAVEFARLARRAGAFNWGIRLLTPYVYSEKPGDAPSEAEYSIYAGLLIKLGVFQEATRILSQIKVKEVDSFLFWAAAHIGQWNYKAAIKPLTSYVQATEPGSYQRATGLLNLIAAQIHEEKLPQAQENLLQIRALAERNQWSLLYNHTLELWAQLEILEENWDQAEQILELIGRQPTSFSRYQLFIAKWTAVLNLKKKPHSQRYRHQLLDVRQRAQGMKHWETMRDCDYQMAVATQNMRLARHLYWGTPFPSYRKKLLRHFPNLEIGQSYVREIGEAPFQLSLCLFEGLILETQHRLNCGRLGHKLLNALSQDFYRPHLLGSLFSQLFPSERFDPYSSPGRVHKNIQRLRIWLGKTGVPLKISVKDGEIVLCSDKGVRLIFSAPDSKQLQNTHLLSRQARLETLKARWPYQAFSSSQGAHHLNLSKRTVSDLLHWARSQRKIHCQGKGPATRYFFSKIA